MIGRRLLDKYEIVRVIGQGGMGTVYEARDLSTEKGVAIKWMQQLSLPENDPLRVRFTQEARIAGKLESPHITQVIELASDPETGVPFQVMELLSGEDVRSCLDRLGPLSLDVALRVAAQACAGLAAAHAAGVIHRDIKPENVFLARKDGGAIVVKLLDFGVAKIGGAPDKHGATSGFTVPAAPMTRSGQVVGTPLYMAPEQIGGSKSVDARCDVYSMGVTLYTMLVGWPPHAQTKSFVQILHTIANAPTSSIRDAAPWVPDDAAEVIDKARAKEPSGRYADASALSAALSRLLPDGSALSEEMLVGAGEDKRRIVSINADTDPNARTAIAPDRAARDAASSAPTLAAPPPEKTTKRGPGLIAAAVLIVVGLLVVAVVLLSR